MFFENEIINSETKKIIHVIFYLLVFKTRTVKHENKLDCILKPLYRTKNPW